MPGEFVVTLRAPGGAAPFSFAWAFESVEAAYGDVCAAIPDTVADLLRARHDPFDCAFLIHGTDGALLMEVPLTELMRTMAVPRGDPFVAASAPLPARLAAETERLRANIARSRWLHDRAAAARRRSADLCRMRLLPSRAEALR